MPAQCIMPTEREERQCQPMTPRLVAGVCFDMVGQRKIRLVNYLRRIRSLTMTAGVRGQTRAACNVTSYQITHYDCRCRGQTRAACKEKPPAHCSPNASLPTTMHQISSPNGTGLHEPRSTPTMLNPKALLPTRPACYRYTKLTARASSSTLSQGTGDSAQMNCSR